MNEPSRVELDQSKGPLVVGFGASWCPHCQRAAPWLESLRADFPDVPFVWVEDGPGLPLGRSFSVKLWPTFVFLRDGVPLARVVRPQVLDLLRAGFETITQAPGTRAQSESP